MVLQRFSSCARIVYGSHESFLASLELLHGKRAGAPLRIGREFLLPHGSAMLDRVSGDPTVSKGRSPPRICTGGRQLGLRVEMVGMMSLPPVNLQTGRTDSRGLQVP